MNFKGYIFDIDGTLTSTNELIFASFNHVTKTFLGKEYSNDEIIKLFGPTEDVILKEWMGNDYEKAREVYYEFYQKNHKHMASIIPGIEEVLSLIKNAGLPLGIFTGKGRTSSLITLNELGIKKYFDFIVTGDDVKNHKPSAEGIIKFISHFNLTPANILMIGDAPVDIQAAREAKVKIASVLWDSYAKEKVLGMESDFVFHTVPELKEFVTQDLLKK